MANGDRTKLPQNVRDIRGRTFGRLTPLRYAGRHKNRGALWECRCACGAVHVVRSSSLVAGEIRSCGCLWIARQGDRARKHGGKNSKLYSVWQGMRRRCGSLKADPKRAYFARGIRVCDRWKDFENFRNDMGDPPSASHSIDRIDNNGPYAPENCRWATRDQQFANTRRNRFIEFDGQRMTIAEWAKVTGLRPKTIASRLRYGWVVSDALTLPSSPLRQR